MSATPCPADYIGFSRSIKVGDETHVQTCLKMAPDAHAPSGFVNETFIGPPPEWTTVGIVYPRPEPPKPPPPDNRFSDFVFVVVIVFAFVAVIAGGRR